MSSDETRAISATTILEKADQLQSAKKPNPHVSKASVFRKIPKAARRALLAIAIVKRVPNLVLD
jgi:hypothetical protein